MSAGEVPRCTREITTDVPFSVGLCLCMYVARIASINLPDCTANQHSAETTCSIYNMYNLPHVQSVHVFRSGTLFHQVTIRVAVHVQMPVRGTFRIHEYHPSWCGVCRRHISRGTLNFQTTTKSTESLHTCPGAPVRSGRRERLF